MVQRKELRNQLSLSLADGCVAWHALVCTSLNHLTGMSWSCTQHKHMCVPYGVLHSVGVAWHHYQQRLMGHGSLTIATGWCFNERIDHSFRWFVQFIGNGDLILTYFEWGMQNNNITQSHSQWTDLSQGGLYIPGINNLYRIYFETRQEWYRSCWCTR